MTRSIALACLALAAGGCSMLDDGGWRDRGDWDDPPRETRGWTMLGTRTVDSAGRRDTIEVGKSEGRFREVMITVSRSAVDMDQMTVVFGDGSTMSPSLRQRFDKGSRSKTIALPGGARNVRRVEFAYRSVNRKRPAVVSLYAR